MSDFNAVDEVVITVINDDLDIVAVEYPEDLELVSVEVPGEQGPPGAGGDGSSTPHTHDTEYYTKSQVNTFLAGKQDAGSYAAAVHGHAIAAITGLQTALDGKQASGDYATNTALTNGLALKADSNHTHTIANVTGLQGALDGKQAAGSYAPLSHTHVIADTTGLQAALDGKQAAGSYATATQGAKADTAVQGNGTILNVVSLTQAAYDALSPKVATTLYVIV